VILPERLKGKGFLILGGEKGEDEDRCRASPKEGRGRKGRIFLRGPRTGEDSLAFFFGRGGEGTNFPPKEFRGGKKSALSSFNFKREEVRRKKKN